MDNFRQLPDPQNNTHQNIDRITPKQIEIGLDERMNGKKHQIKQNDSGNTGNDKQQRVNQFKVLFLFIFVKRN